MSFARKYLFLLGGALGLYLGVRYLLPVLLPFALGALLALAAEPVVGLCIKHLHLPRWAGAGLGVSLTLVILLGLLSLLGALLLRELGSLAQAVPDLQDTARQGISLLQAQLTSLSEKMPKNIGHLVATSADSLGSSGSALLEQITMRLPGWVSAALEKVSQGAIGLGTGVVSGYLISSRLPRLRQALSDRVPQAWKDGLRRARSALGGWLKAQGLLMLGTWAIVSVGLLLLRVPYGPLWAVLIALVDAVPMLGTGTVLLPWALIQLLMGRPLHALGLGCIFAVSALTRSVLEPKLVGRHMGLDPLVTLFSMYAGYRFFGILGLVLSPMLAAAIKAAVK